jgi:hypothetical protein
MFETKVFFLIKMSCKSLKILFLSAVVFGVAADVIADVVGTDDVEDKINLTVADVLDSFDVAIRVMRWEESGE